MISSRNNYMLNKRKAQGLSITTIIIAVIALIVLVVIIAILTGKMGSFSVGVESAASCENLCKSSNKKVKTGGGCIGDDDLKMSDECCCTTPQY